jgi:acetyl-CoA carboxylase biotin carboxyl carrier protein
MSHKAIDFKEVKAIVDWVNLSEDVREFSLKFGDLELFISRNTQTAMPSSVQPQSAARTQPGPSEARVEAKPAAPAVSQPAAVAAPPAATRPSGTLDLAADEVLVKAPMVGTFYAGPKPGAPDFVRVGDAVDSQTVLCIVEVMKLMNNIEAGVTGTVTRILVGNEQPVEYGQPLMVIKKNA